MSELARRHPEGTIYRLGRRDPGVWRFPDWLYADAATGTFGSRYDDPDSEYRVLYTCSVRSCAFVEVLAYHAGDATLAAALADIDENDETDSEFASVPPGHVDLDAWCAERSAGSARVAVDRVFASVAEQATIDVLNSERRLRAAASAARVPVPFGVEDVRVTQARTFTQQVSRFAWEQSTAVGAPTFAGVHY